jgi:hypothetical protein
VNRLLLFAAAFALLLAAPAQAQNTNLIDGSPLFYLTLPPDAAGVARGDARTADASGPLALAYNPAGLAGSGRAIALGHTRWISGATITSGGGTMPLGGGTAALYVSTSVTLGEPNTPFGAGSTDGFPYLNLTAAYARPLTLGEQVSLSVGGAAKVLGERVVGEYARGYALDAGVQVAWGGEALRAGVAVQHIGQMGEVLSVSATPLPRTVRAGLSATPLRLVDEDGEPFIRATLSADASRITSLEENRLHLGLEIGLFEFAALRAGWMEGEQLRAWSFGGGLREGGLSLDYALAPLRDGFAPAHFITVGYAWE